MRNYVIINGVSSLTIDGLAINILPAITKPLMRNEIEEIDGRDGDIITELGYSAYDKEMEIGLWGNYDIDEIIKFFTEEGTVIFSTEPDKYYNFKILNQIDYDKLLKFRTATVVFHCQPFKYPTEEEPIEVEPVVKTGEGYDITIDDTFEGNLQMLLKGNTYQDSTTGKNLINIADTTGITTQTTLGTITLSAGTYTAQATLKNNANIVTSIRIYDTGSTLLKDCTTVSGNSTGISSGTFTLTQETTIRFIVRGASAGYNVDVSKCQLEVGSTPTSYEPYTNGASPNPDYPQPVHVVSGDNTIKVVGKNLLNLLTLTSAGGSSLTIDIQETQISLTKATGSTYQYRKFATDLDINQYKGKTLTITGKSSNNTIIRWILLQDDNTTIGDLHTTYTIPLDTTATKIGIQLYQSTSTAISGTTVFTELMLNEGDTPQPYKPYQSTTYPINLGAYELCKIGDYQDKFLKTSGKNFFDGTQVKTTNTSNWGVTFENSVLTIQHKTAYSTGVPNIVLGTLPSGNYTLSYKSVNKMSLYINGTYDQLIDDGETFVVEDGKTYAFYFSVADNSTVTFTNIMLNTGSTAIPYEPYGSGEWYKKAEINKVVFNGNVNENWTKYTTTDSQNITYGFYSSLPLIPLQETVTSNFALSNNFIQKWRSTVSTEANQGMFMGSGNTFYIKIAQDLVSGGTVENFKTWLSNHNTEVYYVLATPTYTKIEGTLASQLEAVYNAVSYEGQTNIGQTNDDLPFWIEATITYTPPSTIENIGNIYAKPILTITGSGNVGVVLNDIEILQINLGEGNTIAIDVPNLEAYNPSDNTLMNRLVTGDYMKLLIQEGENTLSFNGDVSSYSVTNYTRWI